MLPVRHLRDGEILAPSATVRVVGRTHPLAGDRVVRDLAAGLSIAEILEACAGSTYAGGFIVHIDGHAILPENFAKVRVKAGATVTFLPRLQGGNVWKTILTVVVAVAAIAIAGPLAGVLGFTAGTIAFSVATALISTGVMLAGTLALNALFPTRPPQLSDSAASTSLNSIQGAQNTADPFGPVPVVLGRHRQSPRLAAKWFTEIVGDDQYLRGLLCWGYGPIDVKDLAIGETPLTSFSDYEIEHFAGYPADAAPTLYPSLVDEQTLSVELKSVESWQYRTTAADASEISLDFAAPQGIFRLNKDTGNLDPFSVRVDFEYRPVGTGPFSPLGSLTFGRSTSPARLGARSAVAVGQYEVRARKVTDDTNNENIKEQVVWTALRSMQVAPPVTFPKPLALTALRIKATGQLNGIISTLSGICASRVKAWNGAAWVDNTPSQWPPDLFRHVLQGPANARPVVDSGIDLQCLQDWWTYCVANGFKFNQVVTAIGSVYDKLADIAAAGRATVTFINGKWGVAWDRPDDPIVQHFTPRNSWGFQGQKAYAQQPHGWRVTFINEDNGFTQDERIVYDDGYDAANARLFEGQEFPGVTDPALIWKHGRFHIAQSRLRPEKISLSVGWEHLVCTRGDRVRVTHDALLIGLGAGRVKAVAGQVVTLDELVTIEDGKTYAVTFRIPGDARGLTRAVDASTAAGDYTELTLVGDLSTIEAGNLFAFGETERDSAVYRVQAITHQKDLIATLTLVDDAPEISQADQGEIPDYDPHVSIPADPFTLPPRNLTALEVVDGKDGAVRALMRLTWQVPRFGKIASFEVQQRDDDAGGAFLTVATVAAPQTTVDVPLIAAGVWSFRVRCLFTDDTASNWTSLLGLQLAGLTVVPDDVTNLHIRTLDGQTVLDWTTVIDPRPIIYEIRKGTSWDTGLVVGDTVAGPPWAVTGDGTYHVRAYVLSPFGTRIYSANVASITVAGSVIARNIIVSNDEQASGWLGRLEGGVIFGSFIKTDPAGSISEAWAAEIVDQLALAGLRIAIYVAPTIVDIGRAAECRFWTLFEASGVLQGDDFLAQSDVLGSQDILGTSPTRYIEAFPIWRFASTGDHDVFNPADVFGPTDVFGAGIDWGEWVRIAQGTRLSRYFQPGMVLITNREDTDATGTKFEWFVDVPDRTDDYTELTVPDTGLALTFYPGGYDQIPNPGIAALPFAGGPNGATIPHVQRAIVGGSNGDEVKVTGLTLAGCTIHVVNAGANVTRSGVNLLVRGY